MIIFLVGLVDYIHVFLCIVSVCFLTIIFHTHLVGFYKALYGSWENIVKIIPAVKYNCCVAITNIVHLFLHVTIF